MSIDVTLVPASGVRPRQPTTHPDVAIELARMLDEWEAAMDSNLRGWR